MATLSDADRIRVQRGLMRWWSAQGESAAFLKKDLKDAIDAADSWIDQNAASYNTALPTAFKTNATAAQKTILFCAVALMRVSVEWARRALGEVD